MGGGDAPLPESGWCEAASRERYAKCAVGVVRTCEDVADADVPEWRRSRGRPVKKLTVDIGSRTLTVVTDEANVAVGLRVIVACEGAPLEDGCGTDYFVRERLVCGVVSQGELGTLHNLLLLGGNVVAVVPDSFALGPLPPGWEPLVLRATSGSRTA